MRTNRLRIRLTLLAAVVVTAIPCDCRDVVRLLAADTEIPASRLSEDDHVSEDDHANEVARDVFRAEAYWWKRTTDLKSGSMGSGVLDALYKTLIQPVLKAIYYMLKWLFETLFGNAAVSVGDWSQGLPFLWIAIGLIAIFAGWRIWVAFRRQPTVFPATDDQVPSDQLPIAEELLNSSQNALAANDCRSAIRFAFLALLAWFQDHGQLKYDPSRSNREYQWDLVRWPESITLFRAAADPFERCWYGGRELEAGQVANVIALCRDRILNSKGSE